MGKGGGRKAPIRNTPQRGVILDPGRVTQTPSDGEVTIFLSYSREDDAVYGMIHPFKQMLGHFVYAKSGRKIKAFLDQDSIEWGEIWRDRLESEILGASVFIPLLSASYLDSDNCRMEFNRFQANATALGVKELLLPVLIVDAPAIFNESSTDDVVREAAARQWEVIEDAVLSDAGSAAWKTTMSRLANRFVSSYEAAEAKLADLDRQDINLADTYQGDVEEESDTDDGVGLAELMTSMGQGIEDLTVSAKAMAPAIQALGTATQSAGPLPPNPTPHQLQTWAARMAKGFGAPAEEISNVGEHMFETTKSLDTDIQRLRRIAQELQDSTPSLALNYNEMITQLSGLGEVNAQLNELLDKMKPAEYLSVPLRRSLRPARRGLTRITDSLRLIDDWKPLAIHGATG